MRSSRAAEGSRGCWTMADITCSQPKPIPLWDGRGGVRRSEKKKRRKKKISNFICL